MSNKRKKKNRLRAEKLNAAAARNNLGTPQPTQVRSSRPGSGRVRFHETDLGHFHHISEPREERAPNQLVSSYGKIARTSVILKPPRTIVPAGPVRQFSSEMIAHANFLRESQGENKVEGTQPGSIEAAIEDAKKKQAFYTKQAATASIEANRYGAIVTQLQGALDILTGRKTVAVPAELAPTTRSRNPEWSDQIRSILQLGPVVVGELATRMVGSGFAQTKQPVYNKVYALKAAGKIKEIDGKLQWVEQGEKHEESGSTDGDSGSQSEMVLHQEQE